MDETSCYQDAARYYENVPATIDGMLGGFEKISPDDITGSDAFLKWIFKRKEKTGHTRCADCGAGIGRVSQLLLQRFFGKCDLVEQNRAFCDKAREAFKGNPKLGEVHCCGLQDFSPPPNTYDVVWVQWVIIYLPDQDFVNFLRRMAASLREGGLVVIKDNFTMGSATDETQFIIDEDDSSITRPLEHILALVKEAGLSLVKSSRQKNFPSYLYRVYMLALKKSSKSSNSDSDVLESSNNSDVLESSNKSDVLESSTMDVDR